MLQILGFLLLLSGLLLAASVGVVRGKQQERHKPVLTRIEAERRKEAYEIDLRARVGLPKMHPDPEHAGRQRKARIHR